MIFVPDVPTSQEPQHQVWCTSSIIDRSHMSISTYAIKKGQFNIRSAAYVSVSTAHPLQRSISTIICVRGKKHSWWWYSPSCYVTRIIYEQVHLSRDNKQTLHQVYIYIIYICVYSIHGQFITSIRIYIYIYTLWKDSVSYMQVYIMLCRKRNTHKRECVLSQCKESYLVSGRCVS